MATMTIPDLNDDVKARLSIRAARHGRSIEDEVRSILQTAVAAEPLANNGAALLKAIRTRVEPIGGIELELPPRTPVREPPDFSGSEFGGWSLVPQP